MYVIQAMYSDGRVTFEDRCDNEKLAVRRAQREFNSLLFEGDAVRVITEDGELVWESAER